MKLPKLLIVLLLLLGVSGAANAQQTPFGTLLPEQPVVLLVEPNTPTQLTYALPQPSMITLQAVSGDSQPTLTLWEGDTALISEANADMESMVTLSTFLDAGEYAVQVGTLNVSPSTIMLMISESPAVVTSLMNGAGVSGEVSAQVSTALYSFASLSEPAYLFIESGLSQRGVGVRLVETAAGTELAALSSVLTGTRLNIPAGGNEYRLEITHSGIDGAEPFSLCFVATSLGTCQPAVIAQEETTSQVQTSGECRVTPIDGDGTNLRQSASTSASIITVIPPGDTAVVNGVSPDGSFYSVQYGARAGWVAQVAITLIGNCGSLPTLAPPALPATPMPILPTAAPQLPPPAAPTQMPPPQASGPCHVVFTADERVYTRPEIDSAYIFDQVSAGGEIIPVGRWSADPSWWKTNYGGWWLNAAGTAGEPRGDCSSLPMVAWP